MIFIFQQFSKVTREYGKHPNGLLFHEGFKNRVEALLYLEKQETPNWFEQYAKEGVKNGIICDSQGCEIGYIDGSYFEMGDYNYYFTSPSGFGDLRKKELEAIKEYKPSAWELKFWEKSGLFIEIEEC